MAILSGYDHEGSQSVEKYPIQETTKMTHPFPTILDGYLVSVSLKY